MAFIPPRHATRVEVTEVTPDHLAVSGALTFDTARRAREAGLRLMGASQSREPIEIDCADVKESDSAGLAVLIDWLAQATKAGRTIRYANLPPGIRAAAKISDVETLLVG